MGSLYILERTDGNRRGNVRRAEGRYLLDAPHRDRSYGYPLGIIRSPAADTVMAYTLMAYTVMAYTVMAYTVMAYTGMASIVMVSTVMATIMMADGYPSASFAAPRPIHRPRPWRACLERENASALRPSGDSLVALRICRDLWRTQHADDGGVFGELMGAFAPANLLRRPILAEYAAMLFQSVDHAEPPTNHAEPPTTSEGQRPRAATVSQRAMSAAEWPTERPTAELSRLAMEAVRLSILVTSAYWFLEPYEGIKMYSVSTTF